MIEWDIYNYDINKNEIEIFNIFDHWSFREYAKKTAKKFKTKEDFAEQLRKELMFFFWSKTEYELIIEITEDDRLFLIPWCGCREPEKVKIDVTDSNNFDWRSFAELHTKKQIYGNKAKIDVYDQVTFNWDNFVDYCWANKKEILKMRD